MAPNRRVRRLSWPSRAESDDGFTLIEVLVSLGVIFATLLVLAFTMFSGLKAVGFSRQRTQATTLADQAIEQIRALPFDQLYLSAADSTLASDSALVCSAGSCNFNARPVLMATYGSANAAPPVTPFYPAHMTTVVGVPGTTTYTIKSYVTKDLVGDPTGNTLLATVNVSWSPSQVAGVANSLQMETKLYASPFSDSSPGATTTTTTAPVHSYWAKALDNVPGLIKVTGDVLNLNAADLELNLPVVNASLAGNTSAGTTVNPVSGGTANSSLKAASGDLTILNTPGATATASSPLRGDPDGPHSVSATPGVLQSLNGALGLNTGGISTQITAGASTAGNAVAAKTANGIANTAGDLPAVIPNNSLGFGGANATQTGVISSNISVLGLLNIGVLNVAPTGTGAPGPDTATVNQGGSPGVPNAQTFSASVSKSFSEIDVLGSGLPLLSPVVKLTGFTASASACANAPGGTCPASTATETGQLTILGGVPVDLRLHGPGTIGIPTQNLNIGLAAVVITGNVVIGSTPSTTANSASVTSPLKINVGLTVTLLGVTLVNVQVSVDLGSISASANYTP